MSWGNRITFFNVYIANKDYKQKISKAFDCDDSQDSNYISNGRIAITSDYNAYCNMSEQLKYVFNVFSVSLFCPYIQNIQIVDNQSLSSILKSTSFIIAIGKPSEYYFNNEKMDNAVIYYAKNSSGAIEILRFYFNTFNCERISPDIGYLHNELQNQFKFNQYDLLYSASFKSVSKCIEDYIQYLSQHQTFENLIFCINPVSYSSSEAEISKAEKEKYRPVKIFDVVTKYDTTENDYLITMTENSLQAKSTLLVFQRVPNCEYIESDTDESFDNIDDILALID